MTLWVVVIAVIGCEKNIAPEKRHLLTIGQNQASDLPYEEAVKYFIYKEIMIWYNIHATQMNNLKREAAASLFAYIK